MRSYWAFIRAYTLLTARDWSVVVLSHVIPLAFLIGYIQLGAPVPWALSMALVFAIVTNGVFGAGVRVVQERQLGVLRRLRAAPISAAHIVIGAVASGMLVFVPALVLLACVVLISHGTRLPEHPVAFMTLIAAGMLCCRSLGVLVAALTVSVQQSQLVAQMFIVALLFTSAMAWSPDIWPAWMRLVRDLSPSYHLTRNLFGVLAEGSSLDQVFPALAALSATGVLCQIAATRTFRWDTDEPAMSKARIWFCAGAALVFLLGLSALWF